MEIQLNKNLKNLNTLSLNVSASFFASPSTKEDLIMLLKNKEFSGLSKMVIGSGSNILFKSDFDGLLIHPAMKEIKILNNDDKYIYLKVGAGVEWDYLVSYCVDRGWGGLENLSWIPGCVGAAPVQNIGAYGSEIKNSIKEVEFVNIDTAEEHSFKGEECMFGYRDSIFKKKLRNKVVITFVTFMLSKFPVINSNYADVCEALNEFKSPSLQNLREIIINIRKKKLPDPSVIGNVGSFFKNPTISEDLAKSLQVKYPTLKLFPSSLGFYKIPAAWLIEQCGFKGVRIGNVGVHSTQALVLLAFEGATGDELIDLSSKIQNSVKQKFGVEIEPEVNIC